VNLGTNRKLLLFMVTLTVCCCSKKTPVMLDQVCQHIMQVTKVIPKEVCSFFYIHLLYKILKSIKNVERAAVTQFL
jgi:hypothetical protein